MIARFADILLVGVVMRVLAAAPASAHGLDPAALLLREVSPGQFEVTWRSAALRLPGAEVAPSLPERCKPISTTQLTEERDHVVLRWTVDCGAAPLAGETVGVADLAAARINALLRIQGLSGATVETVLSPRAPSYIVPSAPGRLSVVRDYVSLGVEHILSGPDHLLFVFGLLLLVSGSGLLFRTITAFTLGHSLTLSAAALRLANVPSRPVEVLIAVSVLALAVDLARDADQRTWLRRFPWAMAILFGLLHGFGFAGALAEAGLPAGDVPLALLAFNAGIEIGQLLFVVVVLAAGALLAYRAPALSRLGRRPAVYAMGVLAAFWCFERLAVWLGGIPG